VAVALRGCAPKIQVHGNPPDPDELSRIRPGIQTRDDVAALLGSPSSSTTFGDETWYYISSRIEGTAFSGTEVLDRQVVAITFDDKGAVKTIKRYTLKDGRKIEMVDRVTPTGGRKMTVLQQLVGNFGRFTTDGSK